MIELGSDKNIKVDPQWEGRNIFSSERSLQRWGRQWERWLWLDRQLLSTTTYREVLEEQITPIVLDIEEQAKDQNEKHGTNKDDYIILNQIPGQIALIFMSLIR